MSVWIICLICKILTLIQAGLANLESLNLDSCRIGDDGLVNLTGEHSAMHGNIYFLRIFASDEIGNMPFRIVLFRIEDVGDYSFSSTIMLEGLL